MNQLAVLLAFGVSSLIACVPLHPREAHAPQQVARMCQEPAFAYERGYNHGMSRGSLDTSWADTGCHPQTREQARATFQQGYHAGIANAPIVVQGLGGGRRGRIASSGVRCTFSSDCDDGQSCRSDQGGTNVCMGHGWSGDPCWFSSDCTSGSCDISSKTCR